MLTVLTVLPSKQRLVMAWTMHGFTTCERDISQRLDTAATAAIDVRAELNAVKQRSAGLATFRHATICAIDISGSGAISRTRGAWGALREALYATLAQAFVQAGIPWDECYQEGAGDAVLALAPATVGPASFAEKLPLALVSALQAHNETHPPAERMRLVLHAGEITRDRRGVTSSAIVHAFRLLGSPALKEALAESPGTLAVVASERFFDEVIRHHPGFAPEDYQRVVVSAEETGWLRLPDGRHRAPAAGHDAGRSATPAVHTPLVRPASPEFYQVVDAIEAIPCMQGEHTRARVVEQLRFAGAVRYFATRRAHVTSILRTCLDFEDGVVQLVSAISAQEPSGSVPVERLVAVLAGRRG